MKKHVLYVLTGLLALSIPLSSANGWAQPLPADSGLQTDAAQSNASGMSSGKGDPSPASGMSSGKGEPSHPSGMSSGKGDPSPASGMPSRPTAQSGSGMATGQQNPMGLGGGDSSQSSVPGYNIKNFGSQGMTGFTPAPEGPSGFTPTPPIVGGYKMSPVGKDSSTLMPSQSKAFLAPQGMNSLSVPSMSSPVSGVGELNGANSHGSGPAVSPAAGVLNTPVMNTDAINAPALHSPVNTGFSPSNSPAVQLAPAAKSGGVQKFMMPNVNNLH